MWIGVLFFTGVAIVGLLFIRSILNMLGYNEWTKSMTILDGNHRPFLSFPKYIPKLLRCRKLFYDTKGFMFTESCITGHTHINKLFGFSVGMCPHRNSYRFGWKADGDEISIYAYNYLSGKRYKRYICNVNTDEYNFYSIRYHKNDHVEFIVYNGHFGRLGGVKADVCRHFPIGWRLWVYYGGQKAAPHKIRLYKV